MAAVVALAGKDHYAVVKEDAFMEAPAAEAGKVIGPYDKGETVLGLFRLEGVKPCPLQPPSVPDGGPRLPQLRQTWFCQAEGCGRP